MNSFAASVADLRITDKLFSRIGFQDNIEQSASSFTVELREMEYIYMNLTTDSLVIIDELCRCTNPKEGEILCWNFCEKLIKFIGLSKEDSFAESLDTADKNEDMLLGHESRHMQNNSSLQVAGPAKKLKDITRPFIFMTTHFNNLLKLSDKYSNVTK